MASQSGPSNPGDDNPLSNVTPPPPPAPQPVQALVKEDQATAEPPKEISPKAVFVNSEPIREDQVKNAVNFLSHPRVRGSPIVHRRNFLEKKGLTKEEIDEAFRRVPDPSPANGQTTTNEGAQAAPLTNTQTQAPRQAIQPLAAAPPGVMTTTARRFHWSHAVLAVGFLAVSGCGTALLFKKTIIPKFKSWIRRVVLDAENTVEQKIDGKPSLAEEAAAAAKAAAAAATDVAKASQEMLITKNEEKKCLTEFMSLLDVQLQEIKTMRNAITRLEGQSYSAGRNPVREEYLDGSLARSTRQNVDDKSTYDTRSVRSASPPASAEPPHPKSYMEIMAMVQRGERPPNIRDIDDRPPNPNQPISNPSLAPRTKPWEFGQTASSSSFAPQPQVASEGPSYMAQDNGVTYQFKNDSSAPWWQQKNPRITEFENGDGPKVGSGSNGTVNVDYPIQRRWVPPQPPPVSMPEAAVAIRQPKSAPKDATVSADDAVQSGSELDELQRITKISESGGQGEMIGRSGSSEIYSTEIQDGQVTEL